MRALAAIPVSSVVDDPVRVRTFESGDEVRWERFVEACESATFFHRIGWRTILENVFRHRCHYLLATRDDDVCGVLPLAEVRSRLFGHSLVSLPFCVYGGPAANDADAERALVTAAAELAERLAVDHLELRNRTTKCVGWPRQDLYVTFRKAISADADANLLAIPRKQRAMVRKGIARNLQSEIDETPARFFDLYADNVHRHGTPPLSRRYFAALLDTFGNSCRILTVCAPDGRAVSSVLSFYFRDEVLPYYAGDTPDARALAANDFKYWELMRSAGEAGLRWFDYGRSKRDSGSYGFKRNWGFEPSPLSYEYRLLKRTDVPQNNPANARYSAVIAVWRRLPRPLVNAIGPMIVRGLG
ncbi:MAG TPA: FemAB family XrtA/PEP-CTERM system-associated protein [Casimicrobiaceae bacterium]|nr:FemAB family XrtA/PEP-CTERM system-associated protein [Casimicrobiaceae bacterium]